MHSTLITSIGLFAASALAVPVVLPNNYPPPNDPNPLDFADLAGGGPPNGKLPANISNSAIASFQAVNFLENFESGFFQQAITWIDNWNDDGSLDLLEEVVTTIQAQELIHVATAQSILKAFNRPTFAPCTYSFPGINTVSDFVELATVITVTGIGAVINLSSGLALTDPVLVPVTSSILGNEARQDAFFRLADATLGVDSQGDLQIDILAPQPAAFDTRISAAYALNLASPFISNCPTPPPPFKKIPAMTISSSPASRNYATITKNAGPITFSVDPKQVFSSNFTMPASGSSSSNGKAVYVGWVNQANVIKYTPATLDFNSGLVSTQIPDGLAGAAFAALTNQNTAPDVAGLTDATVAGPSVVIVS